MIILSLLSDDRRNVTYRPLLKELTGTATATILLQQIIYWWDKQGGEFYKFKEPCTHDLYKEGDSWLEEIGFSRSEFDTALKTLININFVTTRKTQDRRTYYTLNENLVEEEIKGVFLKRKSSVSKSGNPALAKAEIQRLQKRKSSVSIIQENTNDYQETTRDYEETQAAACVDSLEEMEKEIQHQTDPKPTTTQETNSVEEPTDRVRAAASATLLQQEVKTLDKSLIEEKFEQFWALYPKIRRKQKVKTLDNFKKAIGKNIAKADEIINSLKKQLDVDAKCLNENLENLDTRFYKKIFIPSFKESYQYLKMCDYEKDWEEELREYNRDNKAFIGLFPVKTLTKPQEYNNSEEVDYFEEEYQELETDEDFLNLLNQVENN